MVPDLADRVDTANPMPAEERATILAERRRVRVGINEMVQELFGLHPSGGTKLYVSDGGHYDNLGLVELLRRRCSVVWVVDASGDRPGTARALSEAILLAGAEVGANVDLDLDRFALDKETDRQGPVLGATHVLGDVRYGDDSRGMVVVIKLGMTRETADALFAYRAGDRRFPHHSTLNQIYRSARFDAYRALGWDSALLALADPAVAAALPVRDESEDVAAG
jgi:hypothetical protein